MLLCQTKKIQRLLRVFVGLVLLGFGFLSTQVFAGETNAGFPIKVKNHLSAPIMYVSAGFKVSGGGIIGFDLTTGGDQIPASGDDLTYKNDMTKYVSPYNLLNVKAFVDGKGTHWWTCSFSNIKPASKSDNSHKEVIVLFSGSPDALKASYKILGNDGTQTGDGTCVLGQS